MTGPEARLSLATVQQHPLAPMPLVSHWPDSQHQQ